ncbi:MAG: TolC family protein [Elusimicrobiota bacterium]
MPQPKDPMRERFAHMAENYPGFDPELIETHIGIIRTFDMLFRTLSKQLRPHGLTPPAMGILFLLDGQERPLPMSAVSMQLLVSQANVTGLTDTLEKAGLVRRLRTRADRRITLIEITPAGRKKIRAFWPGIIKLLKTIYAGVSGAERKTMRSAMANIRAKLLPLLGALLLAIPGTADALSVPSVHRPPFPVLTAVHSALKNNPELAPVRAAHQAALARQLALLGAYDTSISAAIQRLDAKTPPAVFFQTPRTITDSAGIGLAKRFATGTGLALDSSLAKEIDDVSSTFTLNPRTRSKLDLSVTQSLLKGFIGRPERSALREAAIDVRAARADLDRASELLAQRVATAYTELWLSHENKKVLSGSREDAREFLDTTKKLAQRYEAEKDDLLRAETSLLSKDLEVLQADELILERGEELRLLMAAPLPDGELQKPFFPGPAPQEQASLEHALRERPDLQASELRAQRDRLHIESLSGLGLPSLDLSGSLGWSGLKDRNEESLHQLNRAGFRTWRVGLNLSYVFGGRAAAGERLAAASSRLISEAQTHTLRLRIGRDVRISLARLRLAIERVELTKRLENMQLEALDIARNKYRQARITSRDRLQASDTARAARSARLRAAADGEIAEAAHQAAVGGLLKWLGLGDRP